MSHVDLSALRMAPAEVPVPKPPRGPRLLLVAIVLLAVAVATTFLWPLLRPVRSVPMAAVRTTSSTAAVASAIAEAAGWIEPDPFPVFVRPLVEGRIEQLLVLEGSVVEAGKTLIARLGSATLLAAKERAEAIVGERERALAVATARLDVAKAQLEQRAALRTASSEARAELAALQGRFAVARGNRQRLAAEAAGARAAAAAQEQLAAAGSSFPVALARAKAAAEAAEAAALGAAQEIEAFAIELSVVSARVQLAEELAAAPVELQGAVSTATAERAAAETALASARTEQAIAARELGWTEVLAPCDGVVMKLLAAPGAATGPEGEAICSLYDPAKLRARIDVPLGAVSGIHDGQQVELRSEVLGSAIVQGVVQRVQRESDLLKNTLQVKVQVLQPPALLRPETLCRARFLGGGGGDGKANTTQVFVVPRTALRDGHVFRFDPAAGTARAVAVTVLQEQGDDVVVQGELSLAQRVVLVPVQDGEAVREERR